MKHWFMSTKLTKVSNISNKINEQYVQLYLLSSSQYRDESTAEKGAGDVEIRHRYKTESWKNGKIADIIPGKVAEL